MELLARNIGFLLLLGLSCFVVIEEVRIWAAARQCAAICTGERRPLGTYWFSAIAAETMIPSGIQVSNDARVRSNFSPQLVDRI